MKWKWIFPIRYLYVIFWMIELNRLYENKFGKNECLVENNPILLIKL